MSRIPTATALTLVLGVAMMTAPALAQGQRGSQKGQEQAAMGCWAEAGGQQGAQQVFSRLDTDSSGDLSEQEYQACLSGAEADVVVAFVALDVDRSGQVSQDEFVKAADRQQQAQAGQPGQGAQITVQQPPAQVTVEREAPQVTVQQPKPDVTVTQPKPEVTVRQPKPDVTVQQAKPEVTVEREGKPEVTVQQEKQADVTVRREVKPEMTTEREPAEREHVARGEETAGAATQQPWYGELSADQLMGRDIVAATGEQVGEIENIVIDPQSRDMYAVVSVGGFLGIGDKNVAIPFDELQMGENNVILMSQTSEDELKQMPAYEEGQYQEIEPSQPLGQQAGR